MSPTASIWLTATRWSRRAKIVLNVHAADDSSLEMARVAYTLANRRALVTELGRGARLDTDLRDGVLAGPPSVLADLCRTLLADDRRRLALAEHGFPGVFAARPGRDGEEGACAN